MKGKWHFILTTILFVTIWIVFKLVLNVEWLQLPYLIAAIPWCWFPDVDSNFNSLGHRNFWSHNIIVPFFMYLFVPHPIVLASVVAVGFHCLCDIRLNREKWKGKYCVKFLKRKNLFRGWVTVLSLNGKWSTVYLLVQFVISITIFWVMI